MVLISNLENDINYDLDIHLSFKKLKKKEL